MTTDQLTVGSLCTGYGGLDLALKAHFSTRVIWTSEIDKHASRVVKARYRAPNLGDLKLIDWEAIPAPDIITAGYPCQPFSYAGGRNGTEDPRHIWPWIAEGIRHLRPRLAVMENVPGHLTKGFGEVIGTLAEMGYDATWGCVRASDAGACHRRERVFIVATDTTNQRREWEWAARGRGDGSTDSSVAAGGPLKLLPTPRAQNGEERNQRPWVRPPHQPQNLENALAHCLTEWGEYQPAITRWEKVLGRVAPPPALDGRLNPAFIEWMMGLKPGYVTAIDMARTHQIRILGNGVVWQQAELALTHLLPLALARPRRRPR